MHKSGRKFLALLLVIALVMGFVPTITDMSIIVLSASGASFDTNGYIVFPDKNFENSLLELGIGDGTGIKPEHVLGWEYLDVPSKNITSLEGIEFFTSLIQLNCSENKLTSLDVSMNSNLKELNCGENKLTSLNLSTNLSLEWLGAYENPSLSSVTLPAGNAIESLNLSDCKLSGTLDISGRSTLKQLFIGNDSSFQAGSPSNNLTGLNLTGCIGLEELQGNLNKFSTLTGLLDCSKLRVLNIGGCNLAGIDLSSFSDLEVFTFWKGDGPQITTPFNFSNNTKLKSVNIDGHKLAPIGLSNLTNLEWLGIADSNLNTLDLSSFPYLKRISCSSNNLTSLDITNNPDLEELDCRYNYMRSESAIIGFTGSWDGVNFIFHPQRSLSISEDLINILDDAKNGSSTPNDVVDDLKNLNLEEGMNDKDVLAKIKDLEDWYKTQTNITVNVTADNNTHGDFKNNVSIVGATFNAQPGSTVSLHFSKPNKDAIVDDSKYLSNNAVQVEIDLVGLTDSSQLDVPIAITVKIPTGISSVDFRILHYRKDGSYDVIVPVINGDGTCTFIVTGFSLFVFVNEVKPVINAPVDCYSESSSDSSNDNNSQISSTPQKQWANVNSLTALVNNANKKGQDYIRTNYNSKYGVRATAWTTLAGKRYEHDTIEGKNVQVRLYIENPDKIKGDILLSAWVKGSNIDKTGVFFEKWFNNKLTIVQFDQTGSWGQIVKVAVKVDLTCLDVNKLVFYAYDSASNTYKKIANPSYWIDSNGYLHFSTDMAGSIIISEGSLIKK